MLRPASEALAIAYFDALSFVQTAAPTGGAGESAPPEPISVADGSRVAIVESAARGPQGLGAAATPAPLANAKPPDIAESADARGGGDGGHDWALILAIAVPVLGLTVAAGYELRRRWRLRDSLE